MLLVWGLPGCRTPGSRSRSEEKKASPSPSRSVGPAGESLRLGDLELAPAGWQLSAVTAGSLHATAEVRLQGEGRPLRLRAYSALSPQVAERWVQTTFRSGRREDGLLGKAGVYAVVDEGGEVGVGLPIQKYALLIRAEPGDLQLLKGYLLDLLRANRALVQGGEAGAARVWKRDPDLEPAKTPITEMAVLPRPTREKPHGNLDGTIPSAISRFLERRGSLRSTSRVSTRPPVPPTLPESRDGERVPVPESPSTPVVAAEGTPDVQTRVAKWKKTLAEASENVEAILADPPQYDDPATLPQLARLFGEARHSLFQENLEAARTTYRRADAVGLGLLDRGAGPPPALQRMRIQIDQGLQALDAGELDRAEELFLRAEDVSQTLRMGAGTVRVPPPAPKRVAPVSPAAPPVDVAATDLDPSLVPLPGSGFQSAPVSPPPPATRSPLPVPPPAPSREPQKGIPPGVVGTPGDEFSQDMEASFASMVEVPDTGPGPLPGSVEPPETEEPAVVGILAQTEAENARLRRGMAPVEADPAEAGLPSSERFGDPRAGLAPFPGPPAAIRPPVAPRPPVTRKPLVPTPPATPTPFGDPVLEDPLDWDDPDAEPVVASPVTAPPTQVVRTPSSTPEVPDWKPQPTRAPTPEPPTQLARVVPAPTADWRPTPTPSPASSWAERPTRAATPTPPPPVVPTVAPVAPTRAPVAPTRKALPPTPPAAPPTPEPPSMAPPPVPPTREPLPVEPTPEPTPPEPATPESTPEPLTPTPVPVRPTPRPATQDPVSPRPPTQAAAPVSPIRDPATREPTPVAPPAETPTPRPVTPQPTPVAPSPAVPSVTPAPTPVATPPAPTPEPPTPPEVTAEATVPSEVPAPTEVSDPSPTPPTPEVTPTPSPVPVSPRRRQRDILVTAIGLICGLVLLALVGLAILWSKTRHAKEMLPWYFRKL